jgi:hypothetical protein
VFVHESEVNVPVNWTTPFPSTPETTLPTTEIGDPPKRLLPPPASNVGVAPMKVKLAGNPPCPRLQIAKTGFTNAVPKVMVLTPVKVPFVAMASPTASGEVVTVPPVKVAVGFQISDDPFVVVPPQHVPAITWPEYVTETPSSVPTAEPGEPTVAAVQSVQLVANVGAGSSIRRLSRLPPSAKFVNTLL